MQTDASESRHSSIIHTSVQLNTVAQTLPASYSTQPQHHTHLLSWSTSPPRMRCSSPSWGHLPQSVSALSCRASEKSQISAYGPMHVTLMHPFSDLNQTHSRRHADKTPNSQRVFTHQTCSSRSQQSTRCSWQRWWRLSQHAGHPGGALSQHSHIWSQHTHHA